MIYERLKNKSVYIKIFCVMGITAGTVLIIVGTALVAIGKAMNGESGK